MAPGADGHRAEGFAASPLSAGDPLSRARRGRGLGPGRAGLNSGAVSMPEMTS